MTDQTVESLHALFRASRDATPKNFPESSWYLIVAATLIAADGGRFVADLYKYLIAELEVSGNSTQESRKRVSRKLRDVIVKSWTLVGMPRSSDALYALLPAESPEDAASEWSRDKLLAEPEKALARTSEWFKSVLAEEEGPVFDALGTDPDFCWTIKFVVYGLYLADLSVLGPLENELVILSSVLGQGAGRTAYSHLRSMRRIGTSVADSEATEGIIKSVARWLGKDTSSWPKFKEVEHLFP